MKIMEKIGLTMVSLACANTFTCWSQSSSPNFIIILADDLGYGDLGCYGHPTILTPNLDNMAKEGMRFTQFYVGAAVSSPSRAALLTGRLGIRTGVYGTKDPVGNRFVVFLQNSASGLPRSEVTIAEMLKTRGYTTGILGKWHLGHKPEYLPLKQGFDYWFGIDHHQNPPAIDRVTQRAGNQTTSGRQQSANIPWCSLYRNDTVIEENPDMRYFTKRYTEEALKFISENKSKPFFLYYASNYPHVPLYASPEFEGKSKRGLYGDVVSELDWSVGEILKRLKELHLDRNTFVLFTSDNGPWLTQRLRGGSAGILYEGKNSTYEGGMRVPAIAWWPGEIEAGTTCTAVATTMDLLPTFAALSGAELPAARVLDGSDISDIFFSKKDNVQEIVYYYINNNLYAVRKGAWKAHFITHASYSPEAPVHHDPPLLFNIDQDPSEKIDLAARFPDIVQELKMIYDSRTAFVPVPSEIDKVVH
jgi:arylsulfatase A